MHDFTVKVTPFRNIKEMCRKNHYLSEEQPGIRSGINYGLYFNDILVGCCNYISPSSQHTLSSILGKSHDSDIRLVELGRLCILPTVTKTNILSWFVSQTFKLLKQRNERIIVLSYADTRYHRGTIYQALSMKYYGLTSPVKDYYYLDNDIKRRRGKIDRERPGEYRMRSLKHRYLKVIGKGILIKWKEMSYLKAETTIG